MAMQIKIFGVTLDDTTIPTRTFTEGIDFEIGSMLQEGEQAFREEMVAIIPAGNNSTVFRQYAQRIGSRRVELRLDTDDEGIFDAPRPEAVENVDRTGLTDDSIEITVDESEGAVGYEVITTTDETPPTDGDSGTLFVPDGNKASRPENVVTSDVTASGFTLSWDADANATGYEVHIGTALLTPGTIGTATFERVSTNRYVATGLTLNTRYYYYVRGYVAVTATMDDDGPLASGNVTTTP